MQRDLGHYRQDYQKSALDESRAEKDAIQQFHRWFCEADAEIAGEANAMTVATVGEDGFPLSRVVLLKKYDGEGFVFYTNYNSQKGRALAKNPKVCLSFFWPALERQAIITGQAEKVSTADSDRYFASRPVGSKLSALTSEQSSVVPARDFLEQKLEQLERTYTDTDNIPRPKNWGGYRVRPSAIEFWQGRSNRLHDRLRYTLQKDLSWKMERLAP